MWFKSYIPVFAPFLGHYLANDLMPEFVARHTMKLLVLVSSDWNFHFPLAEHNRRKCNKTASNSTNMSSWSHARCSQSLDTRIALHPWMLFRNISTLPHFYAMWLNSLRWFSSRRWEAAVSKTCDARSVDGVRRRREAAPRWTIHHRTRFWRIASTSLCN